MMSAIGSLSRYVAFPRCAAPNDRLGTRQNNSHTLDAQYGIRSKTGA